MKRHLDQQNQAPPYSMWRLLEPRRETVRERIARQWRCDKEEIAFTRNASESLQILQFGFDLKRGDEVLTTTQDYPRMLTTFKQRERREGIVLRQFPLPVPCEDNDEIVRLFESNITRRTRLILMCEVVNITGQLLPVREVVAMARRHGVPVLVDGAHGFAHFDTDFGKLDSDFYATSLHKWLFAPIGTGLLYVRKARIKEVWPLMAAGPELDGDIRKFEEIGTHSAALYLAIAEALTFHQMIGAARKERLLRRLRDRWATRLLAHGSGPGSSAGSAGTASAHVSPSGRVRLHTSLDPRFSCGIGVFQIEGIDSGALCDHLWEKHRILVTGIKHAEFEGVRVTPSVYTTGEELDRFCEAVEAVLSKGL
jgi:selenocysteine lyase/cysteine desulfurase